ncbi:MAG: TetR/AcrR family transcriptional regulator [Syntrophobacteria bacterium]|nr:TetR/AcrR family transcriptional regulator [Deltaproteobacteria bacterium]MDH3883987.1 TetR/AcrR family transcriptional regulator [Desulfobacterales bacterium]MDH3897705.1 TetR/AcrR family transcriptional regulator [Deltaproteobacteria bacterium]MDH4012090.1 TetR/AcrR family transcriptional regulator [Desulfobacterales bacterium]
MKPKRKRMKADERRQEIIRAAMEVFARNGFGGSTTREIAENAGISEAMIYNHFRNKEDLYTAIIDEKLQESEPLYYPLDAIRNRDDQRVFTTIVSNYLDRHGEDTTFLRLLLFSALEGHELASMFVAGPVRKFFEFLADYIRERIDEGAFKPVNPEITSRCLLGMVHYFVLLREILGDDTLNPIDPTAAIETIVNIFCEGVLADDFKAGSVS